MAFQTETIVGGRLNPLGLSVQTDAFLSTSLYESTHAALAQNYIRPIATVTVSPARFIGGGGMRIQPTSFLGVRSTFQGVRYFGSFGQAHTFSESSASFSDAELSRRKKPGAKSSGRSNVSVGGYSFLASTYVQAKLGRFVAKVEGGVVRNVLRLHSGEPYFYEPSEDVLVRNGRYTSFVNVDALAGSFPDEKFRSGLSARFFDARFANHKTGKRMRNVRVGPTVIWNFEESQFLALLAHWHVAHPNRTIGARKFVPSATVAYQIDAELGG